MHDPIRQFLKKRGCPEDIVKGGLKGLIDHWELVVTEVSHGYDLLLEDYIADMDCRQLIEDVVPLATTPAQRSLLKKLKRLDAVMRMLLQAFPKGLRTKQPEDNGWTPERNWWYFSYPKNSGPDLREELQV
jgi:hypothetical protein